MVHKGPQPPALNTRNSLEPCCPGVLSSGNFRQVSCKTEACVVWTYMSYAYKFPSPHKFLKFCQISNFFF